MKIKILTLGAMLTANLAFTYCTNNPKDNDSTSTITPGNRSEVDTATAHRNNTDSLTELKNNRMDTAQSGNSNSKAKVNNK